MFSPKVVRDLKVLSKRKIWKVIWLLFVMHSLLNFQWWGNQNLQIVIISDLEDFSCAWSIKQIFACCKGCSWSLLISWILTFRRGVPVWKLGSKISYYWGVLRLSCTRFSLKSLKAAWKNGAMTFVRPIRVEHNHVSQGQTEEKRSNHMGEGWSHERHSTERTMLQVITFIFPQIICLFAFLLQLCLLQFS